MNEAPRPYFYLPFFQSYAANMLLHTRGSAPMETLLDQARARVAALDPDLPISAARPFTENIKGALLFYDLAAAMLFVFGAAGMALAVLGTYGLVAHTVKQSTHEIGIRMALGASRLAVLRGFLGRGLRLGAIGAVLGAVAALGVGRLVERALFGVTADRRGVVLARTGRRAGRRDRGHAGAGVARRADRSAARATAPLTGRPTATWGPCRSR